MRDGSVPDDEVALRFPEGAPSWEDWRVMISPGNFVEGIKEMIWLERINIRSPGIVEARKVLELCKQILEATAFDTELRVKIFCNTTYATDISIHLLWKSDPGAVSLLGKEVGSALQDFGLISHTAWIEQEEPKSLDTTEKNPSEQGANKKGNKSNPDKRPDDGTRERVNQKNAPGEGGDMRGNEKFNRKDEQFSGGLSKWFGRSLIGRS